MSTLKGAPYFWIFFLCLIFYYFFYFYDKDKLSWHPSEKAAVEALIDIYQAEWKWYSSDIDANAIPDFWARDVAGLYFYVNPATGNAVKLIAKEIAMADEKPHPSFYPGNRFNIVPYKGYVFKMTPYDENGFFLAKRDPATNLTYCGDSFAVIAFPVLNKKLHTFLISSNKKILFKKVSKITDVDRPPMGSAGDGWLPVQ